MLLRQGGARQHATSTDVVAALRLPLLPARGGRSGTDATAALWQVRSRPSVSILAQ